MRREYIVHTKRLALTTWRTSDLDELSAIHSDPETMHFVRHGRPETREETATLIDQYMVEHRDAGYTKWRLVDLHGRLVGRAGFGPHGAGRELGYTIRREQWGRGLASEIATALVEWHVAHAPAIPLYAYVATANPASRRVLAKTGFETLGFEDDSGVLCELFVSRHSRRSPFGGSDSR